MDDLDFSVAITQSGRKSRILPQAMTVCLEKKHLP